MNMAFTGIPLGRTTDGYPFGLKMAVRCKMHQACIKHSKARFGSAARAKIMDEVCLTYVYSIPTIISYMAALLAACFSGAEVVAARLALYSLPLTV